MNQPPNPHGGQYNPNQGMGEYDPMNMPQPMNAGGGGSYLEQKLMDCHDGVVIRQKMDLMEMLTGCEKENVYYAYKAKKGKDGEGKKKGHKIFKFKEKSTYYQRCVAGSCKRFGMKCYQYNAQNEDEDKQLVLRGEKECKCTYYCCNRTEMKVSLTDEHSGQEEYIGRVYDPWDFCNFGFSIYDKADVKIYGLKASCMQCYFWCRCPCDACQRVDFEMTEGDTDKVIGLLGKRGRGCARNAIIGDDNDVFLVDFPANSNYIHRALLMKCAIFIDYTMFEDTSKQNEGQALN